ncbi:Hydroxyisourate hydrolase [Exidia glandulosa HHB12029]|uniref:5-hydroxyisourate hydrolase n=1 Tax=Exidia glandulosa HHB12029 TaxID=1314781 RepID=A0A165KIV3_EXIGL|nr:Hydroxyisourate hydrolase [Exidia glandulosa HHB12029]
MSLRSPVTCHVLDSARGKPASGIPVQLHLLSSDASSQSLLASGATNADGRCSDLLDPSKKLDAGLYKMTFHTGSYLENTTGQPAFYPLVEITFRLASPTEHYHIPLLLSPYSYTTYRGS